MDFINIIGTFFDNSIEHVVALAHLIKDLRLNKNQLDINEDIYDLIKIAKETKDKNKGYFDNYHSLNLNVPDPVIGDWAIVKNLNDGKWYIYKCVVNGYWKNTEEEYKASVNLVEYTKKEELKTINGLSILGEGDLSVGQYDNADSQKNGLMSSENYISLLTILNETIPQIREDINHILVLFGDGDEVSESIQAVLDRYNQIAEFITSLGDNDNGLILYDILKDISDLKEFVSESESLFETMKSELTDVKDDNTRIHTILDNINNSIDSINETIQNMGNNFSEQMISLNNKINTANDNILSLNNRFDSSMLDININIGNLVNKLKKSVEDTEETLTNETNRAIEAEENLALRISTLEQNPVAPKESVKHIFLTQSEYDALEHYEVDTLYLILEHAETVSHFGDTFPLIFG